MNLIITFSARENGNCGHIADFIKGQADKVVHYKDLNTHSCSNCEYECMDNQCKYRSDDVYGLYESFYLYDKVILIVPMYCGNPSSLYFSFNERCQDFFMRNEDNYGEVLKRLFIIGVYGCRRESPDFISCFEKWFEDTPYKKHVLGIERRLYKQKMKDSILEEEDIRTALKKFVS